MSVGTNREGHDFSRAEKRNADDPAIAAEGHSMNDGDYSLEATTHLLTQSPKPEAQSQKPEAGSRKPEADSPRRMLAVTQFFEDDDMAYVLDRMLSRSHPMHDRLESGRYFIRYVEVHDPAQRRSICGALNQWIASSSERATGIGSHFATSLELTPTPEPSSVGRTLLSANCKTGPTEAREANPNNPANKSAPPEVVADPGIHRSSLFPSGF
jgi:hypothetical protein